MSARCTGLTAAWCPVHGDCSCDGGPPMDLDDPRCPLHSTASRHPLPDGVLASLSEATR